MYKSLFKPIDPVVAEKYSQSHGLESVYEDVIPMQQPAQQPYQPTTPPVQQQPQQQPAQQVQQPLQQTQQVQQPVQQPQQSQQTQQSQQVQQTPQLMSTIKQLIDANPQAAAIIRNYVNTKAAQLQQTQQQPAQQVQQQSQGTQPVQIAQQPQQPVQESKHGLFGVDMRLVNADAAKGLMKYQTMLKEENETRNALKASIPDGSDNATTKPEKSAEPVSHIDNPFDDDESIKYSPEYNNGDITIKERHDNVKLTNPEPFNPEKPKLTDMSNPTGVGKTVFKQDKDGSDVSESRFVGKHGRIYESIQDPALKATIIQEYINDDKTPDTFSISELHDWIDRNYPEVASDPTFFDSIARDIEQHIIYEDDIDDNSIFSDADGSDDFEDFDDVDEDDIDVSDEVDEYITDSGLFDYDEEDATDWYIEKHPDYEDDDLEDFLDLVSDEYADDMNESFNTMNESRDDDFLESDRFLD